MPAPALSFGVTGPAINFFRCLVAPWILGGGPILAESDELTAPIFAGDGGPLGFHIGFGR